MESAVVDTVALGGSVAAYDMSVWSLFLRAGIVVKLVMLSLFFASFWCWAIIIEKVIRMRRVNAQSVAFEEAFWSGGSLDDLYERIANRPQDPMASVFNAGMREWRRTLAQGPPKGDDVSANLRLRVDRVMAIALGREMERLERYMGFLASVGSTAPFVGLFGTVWGIMDSFQAIAITKNTSLAVVAPGISEALFATALGLVAAIPAVIAYNKLNNDLGRFAGRVEAFVGEFGTILSRQLEEGR